MLIFFTTWPHFVSSSSKNLANSAGLRGTITAPSAANGFFTSSELSGDFSAVISRLSLSMMCCDLAWQAAAGYCVNNM